jgi:predicted nucleotidyltransferase
MLFMALFTRGLHVMDKSIQNDLDVIVSKVSQILPKAKIYLFGSYAAGTQREDSDIDLCVVVPEFTTRQMETIFSIRKAIRGATKIPVDVLAFKNDDFESRAKLQSTIQHTIVNKGVLLNG